MPLKRPRDQHERPHRELRRGHCERSEGRASGFATLCTDISTTSFYASHVITAGGCGGMVMFNDEEHLKRALMFRDWGRIGDNIEEPSERFNHSVDGIPYDWKFLYGVAGYHLKACEMNAAFGLVQLDKLDGFLDKRRRNVERYLENLKDCDYYTLPDDSKTILQFILSASVLTADMCTKFPDSYKYMLATCCEDSYSWNKNEKSGSSHE